MLDGASTTIVAVATPAGKGAIAIVRASGPSVPELVRRLVRTKSHLRRRVATYATIVDENGDLLDHGLAIFFQAPHSYTGEDMLELQIHGSPVVAREVVRALLACGAALAEPGEFTRRAFLNGKMGLHAAAAVADIIDAQTRSAARAALANFDSGLALEVRAVRSDLAAILEELEGTIDFPDEVPEPDRDGLKERLAPIRMRLERLRRDGELGKIVREGLGIAIVGPPNAGKSSLLSAAGHATRYRLRNPGYDARYDRGEHCRRRRTGSTHRHRRHPSPCGPFGGPGHRAHGARAGGSGYRSRRRRRLTAA